MSQLKIVAVLGMTLFGTVLANAQEAFVTSRLGVGVIVSGDGQSVQKGNNFWKCWRDSDSTSRVQVLAFPLQAPVANPSRVEQQGLRFLARYRDMTFRELILYTSQHVEEDGSTTVIVAIDDHLSGIQTFHDESNCTREDTSFAVERDFITGDLSVVFRPPPNTWAVQVTRKKYQGILSTNYLAPESLTSLNPSVDSATLNQSQTFWTTPEMAMVAQNFRFTDLSLGQAVTGSFTVNFKSMRGQADQDVPLGSIVGQIHQLAAEVSQKANKVTDQKIDRYIGLALTLLSRPDMIDQIASTWTFAEVAWLNETLKAMADSSQARAHVFDLKMASLLLDFELTRREALVLAPFCANDLKKSSSALQAISSGLQQSSFESYLRLFAVLQPDERRKSYAELFDRQSARNAISTFYRTVDTTRSKPFTTARRALAAWRNSIGLDNRTEPSLDHLEHYFGELARAETQFRDDVVSRTQMYNPKQKEMVFWSDLSKQVQTLTAALADASREIAKTFRLPQTASNISGSALLLNFKDMFQNLSIFFSHPMDGDLRKVQEILANSPTFQESYQIIQSCVGEVPEYGR